MDNIVLGLLILESRTIYQLRDRISKGLNLMYSCSMGSIQAALKKLLNNDHITFEEIIEKGKYKKVYSVTESGKETFFKWINAPMENQSVKNPELAKVYFMGFSDKQNRETNIRKHLDYLKEQYAVLDEICKSANRNDIPEDKKDIFNYQLLSALYGKDFIKFNIDWYENLLRKIKEREI